jgi:type II secretory pathway predicted ATPase ExeA
MYLHYFGLKDAPFRITPDTGFWFAGAQRGEILEALGHALAHGEGLTKIVGEVGSGKTMLLRMLMTRLPAGVDGVYLANPTLSADEMLAALLTDLGEKPKARATRQTMLDKLNRHLLEKHAQGRRVAVFVEEAQAMSLDTLEFLRLLTNLETARDKLLQIVLFGQPELDDLLSVPRMRQIKDRITLNIHLAPLPADIVPHYLRARLEVAGYRGPDLFNARVAQAIARYSGGLTRRINILADKTLLAAYGAQTHNLSVAHVEAAARDSELAPRKKRLLPDWKWITTGLAAALGLLAFTSWLGAASGIAQASVRSGEAILAPAATPAAQARLDPLIKPHRSPDATKPGHAGAQTAARKVSS